MRTLALLAALLLLALHGQAGPLVEMAEQVPPEAQFPAQDEAEAEDQDVAVSFDGSFARAAAGCNQRATCYCRPRLCSSWETVSGTCTLNGIKYNLCCS